MQTAAMNALTTGLNEIVRPQIRLGQSMNVDLKTFVNRFGIGILCYLAGSLLPAVIMMGAANFLHLSLTENKTFFVLTVLASFVCGFGWQLFYLNKRATKDGISLREAMACNLDSLGGNWKKALAFALVGVVISAGLDGALQGLIVNKPHQVAADLANSLHGFDLVVFGLLAAVIAPVVEEALFRGYVFNALRSGCRKNKYLGGKGADLWANLLSAALFAGMHMEPSAFLPLFVFGILLAEVYRRSGSIVCPMLMHAINNSMALAALVLR